MRRRTFLTLTALAALCACNEDKKKAEKALGPPLIGVDLEGLDGTPDALENYRGKVVVLNVWATWCAPCRREMPGLQKLADSLDPKDFAVLGVAINDTPAMVREFLRSKSVSFARHIDRDGSMMAKHFNVNAIPSTFVIDRGGRLAWGKAGELDWGDEGVIRWLRGLS